MKLPSCYGIKTFGCTHNQSDSQKIEQILFTHGLYQVDLQEADLIIINTCAVKQATDSKIFEFLNQLTLQFPNKIIAITGCLPFIDNDHYLEIKKIIQDQGFILHPQDIDKIYQKLCVFCMGTLLNSNFIPNIFLDKSLLHPKIEPNSIIGIVQISEGCNNNCSYCCTKIARGKLNCFNSESIINQIRYLLNKGIKEIHITSQDLGNYNYNGFKLHDLIKKILQFDDKFFIRLGMMNPEYLIENLNEFLPLFKDKRIYRFLHIPIQSGSNNILLKMNRNYRIEQINCIINSIKDFDNRFTFSTDIIVGFPTETDEDHIDSMNFIKQWKPRNLNISKFSPRPNTEAKILAQIKSEIIKKRSLDFTNLFQDYSSIIDRNWIGWEGDAFINEYRKNSQFQFMGRNLYYIPILSNSSKLGIIKRVKIYKKLNFSFVSEI